MSIIELSGISKVYRTKEIETTALENVNLQVNKGEFVSIMGPSGCGKSTLLNIIGLLDKATTGTVTLLGNQPQGWSDAALSHFRNENLGFVFQSFHLIPSLNVAANVSSRYSNALKCLTVSSTSPHSFPADSASEWQ